MWLGAVVDVEGCGGGVALVRAALGVGEEEAEDAGESWRVGERVRLKDAIDREQNGFGEVGDVQGGSITGACFSQWLWLVRTGGPT